MTNYRDIGIMGSSTAVNLIPTEVSRSQVYQATHSGGGLLLPARLRSFISFSFGGRNIEDFDLIACSANNNGISRSGYAEFEDLVTSYDIMDGQYYHGTHFSPFTLSLKLVTDAIDQKMLDDFLHWFRGGITRELILAEHPNRAIMARVSAPPELDMTPFEKKIEMKMGSVSFTTSTTVYRGFIDLEFVSDNPFWYAKKNLLLRDSTTGKIIFDGINIGDSVYHNDDVLEALKIVYEDTVPTYDLVGESMHFGGNAFAQVSTDLAYTLIVKDYTYSEDISNGPADWPNNWNDLPGYWQDDVDNSFHMGARISENGEDFLGRIAGPTIEDESNAVSSEGNLSSGQKYYFFYGGTAPSPTILSFGLKTTIHMASAKVYPIEIIANSYNTVNDLDYSTIQIVSQHTKELRITTPNIITSWNKALAMINKVGHMQDDKPTWKDFADNLRDYIRHPAVRAYAISVINYMQTLNKGVTINNTVYYKDKFFEAGTGKFRSLGVKTFREVLTRFFKNPEGCTTWETAVDSTAEFIFNAETGEAIGNFQYWQAASSDINIASIVMRDFRYLPNGLDSQSSGTTSEADAINNIPYEATPDNYTVVVIPSGTQNQTDANIMPSNDQRNKNFVVHTENVGDMLRSNWLFIEDRNEFDSEGKVKKYSQSNPKWSHYLTHDLPEPMQNLRLQYKYMYL